MVQSPVNLLLDVGPSLNYSNGITSRDAAGVSGTYLFRLHRSVGRPELQFREFTSSGLLSYDGWPSVGSRLVLFFQSPKGMC